MRLSLRFIIPLAIAIGLMAYGIVPLVDTFIFNKWFARDVDIRTKLITSTMQDALIDTVQNPSSGKIQKLFNRVIQDERLYALAFCDSSDRLLYKTQTFPDSIVCDPLSADGAAHSRIVQLQKGPLHLAFHPIEDSGKKIGQLVLVHDMSFLEKEVQIRNRILSISFAR